MRPIVAYLMVGGTPPSSGSSLALAVCLSDFTPSSRARLFSALFSGHLVHYFDEDWWRNPRCGPFLKKQWAAGRKLRVDELAKEIGYDGLTVKPLVKLFTKNL